MGFCGVVKKRPNQCTYRGGKMENSLKDNFPFFNFNLKFHNYYSSILKGCVREREKGSEGKRERESEKLKLW